MSIVAPLPSDPPIDFAAQYIATLPSPASRRRMTRVIQKLSQRALGFLKLKANPRRVPWATMDRAQVLDLVRKLDDMHPSSQRLHTSALRGVLREANAPASVIGAAKASRGSRVAPGRALDLAEIRALERAAEHPRDAALIAIAVYGGLRVSELVGLDATDWSAPVLSVVGKGDKERRVVLPAPAAKTVDAYLRGRAEGPLLRGWKGHAYGQRMTVAGVQQLLRTLAKRAKLEHFSPHDLRRTCVTVASAAGVPLEHIAAHVGHSNVAITAGYLRVSPLVLSRATAQKMHLHFSQANARLDTSP